MPNTLAITTNARSGSTRRALLAVVVALGLGGCNDAPQHDAQAYAQALENVRRHETILAELERQVERHFGEFFLYRLEARLQMGQADLFQLGPTDPATARQVRKVEELLAPFDTGLGRLVRFLRAAATRLPWHDRSAGYLFQRNAFDRYDREIRALKTQIAAQKEKIREAQAYAKLLAPPAE